MIRPAVLLVVLLGAAAAQEEDPWAWPPYYGNAPERMVPFRRVTPWEKYFVKPQPFRGPGRDDADPAGLRSLKVGLLAPAPATADGPRGLMMRRGVELAFDEANAARRPDELPFELVVRLDAPLWGSAANIMVDFACQDEVLAVIGTVDGTATHVALRVGLKVELFMVNTGSSDPTITETNIPWLLRVFPDDRQHGYRLAEIVATERGHHRIVVFRSNDRYGRMGVKVLLDALRRLGTPALLEMRFTAGDQAFDTQVERITAAEPDAVVFWGEPGDVGRAAAALRRGGLQAEFFGPDRLYDPAFLKAAGAAAEGATLTFPFDPERGTEAWRSFRQRFEKRYGVPPDYFAGYAYDGARITIDGLRHAGPNRYRFRDALSALRKYEGVMGTLVFDPTFNNLAPLAVARVVQGAFHFEPPARK